ALPLPASRRRAAALSREPRGALPHGAALDAADAGAGALDDVARRADELSVAGGDDRARRAGGAHARHAPSHDGARACARHRAGGVVDVALARVLGGGGVHEEAPGARERAGAGVVLAVRAGVPAVAEVLLEVVAVTAADDLAGGGVGQWGGAGADGAGGC